HTLAINGGSAALMSSGIPFEGPIGAVRLAYTQEGTWIPNPTYEEGDAATFEIVIAGRVVDDDVAIMMVEAGGTEKAFEYYDAGAPKVSEDVVAEGIEQAKTWIRESVELQLELVSKVGRKQPLPFESGTDYGADVFERVAALGNDRLVEANRIADKTERNALNDEIAAEILATVVPEFAGREKEIKNAIRSLTKKV